MLTTSNKIVIAVNTGTEEPVLPKRPVRAPNKEGTPEPETPIKPFEPAAPDEAPIRTRPAKQPKQPEKTKPQTKPDAEPLPTTKPKIVPTPAPTSFPEYERPRRGCV